MIHKMQKAPYIIGDLPKLVIAEEAKLTLARKAVVYCATNSITGHIYIGLTCQFSRRKSKHRRLALVNNSPTYFHRAIRKYGWDAFSFTILVECDDYEFAKQEEIRLIAEHRPQYNMTTGGDGAHGYKHTPEVVAAIIKRTTGRPGYWKGRSLPAHVVANLASIQAKRTDKARVLAMGPKSIQRRVVCLDDSLEFESCRLAALHYGVSETVISSVCNKGRHKTAAGLVFRFHGDHLGGKDEANRVRDEKSLKLKAGAPSYGKPVVCKNDGRIFETVKAAGEFYGIDANRVTKSASGKYKSKTWEKLSFSYVQVAA